MMSEQRESETAADEVADGGSSMWLRDLSLIPFAKQVFTDFRQVWWELLVFDVVFQLLRAWLIAPLIALALAFILLRAGHVAVSNQDIVGFLLTPWGGLYVMLLGAAAAALFLLEQGGMLAVTSVRLMNRSGRHLSSRQHLQLVWAAIWRISRLGFTKIVLLLLTLIPFVALAFIAYLGLLTRYDIYYYLNVRPTAFWIAAAIGAVLLMMATALGTFLFVRWSLALPIALFENQPATAALTASRQRVSRAFWPVTRLVLAWWLGTLIAGAVTMAGFRFLVVSILAFVGEDPLPLLGAFLAAQAALLAILSFVSGAGWALIVHRLYRQLTPYLEQVTEAPPALIPQEVTPIWFRTCSWLAVVAVVSGTLTLWGLFAAEIIDRPVVLVTAHRGLARHAPENTLVALQKAIDVGADYAEIDVHQTLDGAVVLLHDRDLRRVAGDSRRLDQLTLQEVRQLDVGSWFSPDFADQRVPTLEEAIELCRGKIRLNIEIKVFGPVDQLAKAVAQIVRQQNFEAECIVTSLSNDALVVVRQECPNVPVGIIVGHSIGNINRLAVDAISVRAEHLSDEMIRTAHRQGRQVMVWGISGEQQMTEQLRRGVDNLITSDPELALQLRDRWQNISDHERLLLASRLLLGLNLGDGKSILSEP